MLGSITFRALGIHALRVLAFLQYEHAAHGGKVNGSLGAPYLQLETWGVTSDDVSKGLAELTATGFVRRTSMGFRRSGGGEPSRYALTWLPTHAGSTAEGKPPTHDWRTVLETLHVSQIGNVQAARAWLRSQTGRARRSPAERAKRLHPVDIEGTPHLRGETKPQVRGDIGQNQPDRTRKCGAV